ncbi:MAG: helix-turn-helix domain-containing protein [Actinomycetota bacterium]|nr:helix-turn-helix domain-containing protein [Actinomycetota bacterium]
MRATTPRELGLLVRTRRHDLRLSQQDLANRARVSRPWLVAVEAGHPRAELGKLLALLGELGLTLDLSPTQTVGPHEAGIQPRVVDLDALLESHDTKRRSGSST